MEPVNPFRPSRIIVDILFGIALPILCFAADPVLFEPDSLLSESILPPEWKTATWVLSGIGMVALLVYSLNRSKHPWLDIILAPFLFLGSLVALGIAVVIFPTAVVGAMFLIGLLGFVPIATAYVFLRAFTEAARRSAEPAACLKIAFPTLFVCIAAGLATQTSVSTKSNLYEEDLALACKRLVETGNPEDWKASFRLLAKHCPRFCVPEFEGVLEYYDRLSRNDPARDRFKDSYMKIIGRDVDEDLRRFRD